jgi:hypothetical protein
VITVDILIDDSTIVFFFFFAQLFQSGSGATLKNLIIFVSVWPELRSALLNTADFQISLKRVVSIVHTKMVQWFYFSAAVTLAPVLGVGNDKFGYFDYS